MIRTKKKKSEPASERKSLRRRISQFYNEFNRANWEKCFLIVDPALRETSKVKAQSYAEGLRAFQAGYGSIKPWHVRISLHLDGSSNKHDQRPFAFVYVVWQDKANQFHMFRERWVKVEDHWFTRVAGLVSNRRIEVED
jgi:hypothetical protein